MADGTKLADAYVQIIPSAKGIKGKITEELGGEADSAGKSAGLSIASAIKGVIAAAGIGAALKATISEGANLQQSLGGIETLFKDSADKVVENAKMAYKTAGMSANEYMETVTSFSASLLQGLAGDTGKAADVADMALTDMADNANKMGTSMELIQNAYQGFAKQNYTMLDNLKLGYGGTKTEMQRLLADAQKLTGVKYNIDNLSDVYEAIHAVQEEMGITGTTAKEAASTFSGSLASMKAAFSDLLGNLSLGEDIGPSLKALGETLSTFLTGNLVPMVINIISGLGSALININWLELASSIITQIGDGLSLAATEIFGVDGSAISTIFSTITDKLPTLFEGISTAFETLWTVCDEIWTNIGQPIFDAVNNILGMVMDAFAERMPAIQEFVGSCFSDIKIFWENNLKPCLEAIGKFIKNILAPAFEKVFEGFIGPIIDTVFGHIKNMWEHTLKPVFTGITDFLTGVFTLNFEKAWEGIKSIFKGIINGILTYIESWINGCINAINGLISGIGFLAEKAGDLLGFEVSVSYLDLVTIPKLEKGGILEKGQIGLLEGSGAEAVVPLENNAKWIAKVAQDLNAASGNDDILRSILEVLMELRDDMPEELADKISRMKFEVNNREVARLVKAVS